LRERRLHGTNSAGDRADAASRAVGTRARQPGLGVRTESSLSLHALASATTAEDQNAERDRVSIAASQRTSHPRRRRSRMDRRSQPGGICAELP